MTYELALKLKNAGFKSNSEVFIKENGETYKWNELKTGGVLLPNLSELIEACGESGFILQYRGQEEFWLAEKYYGIEKPQDLATGSTPEEAVAKLWLVINKK